MNREEQRRQERVMVASTILAARTQSGLTQEGLASALTAAGHPSSRTQVARWERDARDYRPDRRASSMPNAYSLLLILEVTELAAGVRRPRGGLEAVRAHYAAIRGTAA